MSKKGYVASAGGFFVAISSVAKTENDNTEEEAVNSTNTATESPSPSIHTAVTRSIKKSA